jgi:hypothetical protein
MRLSRISGALVALVLAATAGQAYPAQGASATQAAKPEHHLVVKGKEIGKTDKFVVHGRVSTLTNGKVKVLRNVSGGKYTVWKKVRTSATGAFRTRIYQVGRKRTCFKVQVHATTVFKKTTSPNVGCIYTA